MTATHGAGSGGPRRRGAARPLAIAGALALGLALGALLAYPLRSRVGPPAGDGQPAAAAARPAAAPQIAASPPSTSPPLPPAAGRIATGRTLEVAAASLRPGEPFVVDLDLGVPSANAEPRPVFVTSSDGRSLETRADVVGSERLSARLAVPSEWLAPPGRYLIRVKTTERSHLPVRGYTIEVR